MFKMKTVMDDSKHPYQETVKHKQSIFRLLQIWCKTNKQIYNLIKKKQKKHDEFFFWNK